MFVKTILDRYQPEMRYHTDLRKVFEAINDRQNEYNWLLSDLECNHYPDTRIPYPPPNYLWLNGKDISDIVYTHDIQFIWGVLSGFKLDKALRLDPTVIPYAENPALWTTDPQIQHPEASVEIVCWDSTSTLFLSNDDELSRLFRKYFSRSQDLKEYNSIYNSNG
jgi:hypothetical protein